MLSAPGDYTAQSGVSLTFLPSGDIPDTRIVPVTINEDGDRENPEVFSGRLRAQAGDMMVDITQDRATVRILDFSGKSEP